jgi:hypothetical protein
MPHSSDSEFDPDLLDLYLGQLSPEQRAELERRISADPALAKHNQALAAVFRALDSAPEPVPPADLAQRVSARVAAAGPAPRVVSPPSAEPEEDREPRGIILRVHSVRDVVAVAAMIVLAVGLGVPSLLHVRERNQRIACSNNLAQVGRGMQAYAASFGDSLPFVGWRRGHDCWQPTSEPGVAQLPNRRQVFPLLRGGHVRTVWFVCPAGDAVPMPAEQVRHRDDFIESRNLSYAYQNMAGVRPSLLDDPRLPILADDNPCFDDGRPLFDAVRRLGFTDPAQSNSRAHHGAGQNILTLDGRVIWTTNPNSGINGDNIWTLDYVNEYTGHEGPKSTTDTHLLK